MTEIKGRKPDIAVVNKNERGCTIIDVVLKGAFDSTSKKLKKCIEELRVVISTALLQKTALLQGFY